MEYASFLQQVQAQTGLRDAHEADRALRAAVSALGECLNAPDRTHWAKCLPAELGDDLIGATFRGGTSAHDVYARMGAGEGVPPSFAKEHAQAVIRVLAAALQPDERRLLARHLPDEIGTLLSEAPSHLPPPAHAPPPERPTGPLATGAPGSRHPLSEARPGRPQSGSVAAWDEARVAHTLGSGHEDADRNSLAGGKPGSKRGLSGD